jgi:glycosyltransferase involved in cell wall biosynthesis
VALFEKWTPATVEGVTTNTHFMRQNLLDWGVPAEAITYLPNGIEPGRFTRPSEARRQALRERLNLVGKRVVLYVGSLSLPSHPVDLLLQAFAAIAPTDPDLRLLVVGGGEQLEAFQTLAGQLGIAETTIFAGRAAPEEVAAYYALAEVSVDPVHDDQSARGRSPLKLFESWACEVPFVSATVGDRPSLAGDPPAALLTEPGDPTALATALTAVLTQPELAAALRQAGRHRLPAFTFDRLAQDLEAVYRVNRPQTRP